MYDTDIEAQNAFVCEIIDRSIDWLIACSLRIYHDIAYSSLSTWGLFPMYLVHPLQYTPASPVVA